MFLLLFFYWHPAKLMVAAVDVAPAVTVNCPLAEFVLTVSEDGLQSAVPPKPGTNACAPTVYATAPVACVYVVPELLKVPTLGLAAGTPRL